MSYAFNPDSQRLADIECQGEGHWLRIHCIDGEVFEAYADCWTYTEFGDDEDADAMHFIRRDGTGYTVAGAEIDRFEVLEERNTDGTNAHEH